jgi:hypothetical protein
MINPQTSGKTQMQIVEKKMEKKKSWGTFLNSHHFWGGRVC